jgi:hypothetical protein
MLVENVLSVTMGEPYPAIRPTWLAAAVMAL